MRAFPALLFPDVKLYEEEGTIMAYETIDVQEMSPSCGAIIEGIDLSQGCASRQRAAG